MLAVAWQLPNSNCLSQGHPTWSCCRVHQTPHGWRGQRISCQDDINDFQQPFLMPLSDTNKKQFPKSSNIYIYIYQTWLKSGLFATFPTCLAPTFDVMRNVSSIFRDVFSDVRCPGYGQVVSWGSPAAPAAVRWSTWSSAPGGRWGSPPWRHLAPECATWRLAMVLIFHDESNKSNKSNEPRYTKMLLHEKNVASC